jgi:serine/threonine-protein kinase
VAGGLAAVHDAGIAHGDVKPANVLLSSNRVMLTDLGLVRIEADPDRLKDIVPGTPWYVAPELVLGTTQAGNAHLVDIYAFGVTAFEALALRPPYDAEHIVEIFALHVNASVPRVSDLRADVPDGLVRLIAECMAKDPHERPASMREVLFRLDAARSRLAAREPLEVLVVDDDVDIARLLAAGVREAAPSANVRTVHDGTAAIAAFQSMRPHVLILDLMMPGMSGIEVFGYLRGSGLIGDCDVLFVSAAGTEADMALVTALGARAFVSKGEGLRRRVRELVRGLQEAPPGVPSARPAS